METNNLPQESSVPGITGKAFIVTGGHRGIGLALSESLLSAGARVGVLDLPPVPDHAFQQMQSEYRDSCFYSSGDVSDSSSLKQGLDVLFKSLSTVDGCVTAAGICIDKSFAEHTWEDYAKQSAVNACGTFFTVQWTVQKLRQVNKPGAIVMIASQAARHVCPGHLLSAYAASKGAVLALARNLAIELADCGIRVNTISPGYIATEMNLSLARSRPEIQQIFHQAPPLGRMGSVNDVTGGLIYLLSDRASYVTGVDLEIDGGMGVSVTSGSHIER